MGCAYRYRGGMSCDNCHEAQDQFPDGPTVLPRIFVRIDVADVELVGCQRHQAETVRRLRLATAADQARERLERLAYWLEHHGDPELSAQLVELSKTLDVPLWGSSPVSSASERYQAAAHAMQSGVRLKMSREGAPDDGELCPGHASPKHLRVGVNSAMSDQGALVRLLLAKGIIDLEEYEEAVADAMEREVQTYRDELGLGPNVTLR